MLKRAFESLRFQVVLDADRIYRQKKHDSLAATIEINKNSKYLNLI